MSARWRIIQLLLCFLVFRFLPFHYLICALSFQPSPPAYFPPFSILRRADQINKYSWKKSLLTFRCVCDSQIFAPYLLPAALRTRRLFTTRFRIQQEGDSAHAQVKSAIREVNCARSNPKATSQTLQTCFSSECAAPARRWEERTTSFEA